MLLYLLAVVMIAVVGGMAVALGAPIAAAFLINYYFVQPEHTLDVAQGEQALALAVFLIVAAVVSGAVELAAQTRARRGAGGAAGARRSPRSPAAISSRATRCDRSSSARATRSAWSRWR